MSEEKGTLTSIDHIVLTASDMDQTISFYCDILGMELKTLTPSDGGEKRWSLKFGDCKINLHDEKSPYNPHAKNPISGMPGTGHLGSRIALCTSFVSYKPCLVSQTASCYGWLKQLFSLYRTN